MGLIPGMFSKFYSLFQKLYGEVVIYRDILESKAHFDMSAAATVMTTQSTHSEKMHSAFVRKFLRLSTTPKKA